MGRFKLTLVLVILTWFAAMDVGSPQEYPLGDARQCIEAARKNNYTMERFQVLPVFGWDNLRNLDEGQVISLNYSKCRTTTDGHFLLPDGVSALPVRSSAINTFAELITQWKNWKSSTSRTINVEAGMNLRTWGIGGKFSAEFEEVKTKQIDDKSITTRAQIRYVRYQVQLQPDAPLSPAFKNQVLRIAAAKVQGHLEQAVLLSQLLVRDFGTHIVTRIDAGASLEQVDQVREEWVRSEQTNKRDILAAASAFMFDAFKQFDISASYIDKVDTQFKEDYRKQRTSSSIVTNGGALFRPDNFTKDQWAAEVDGNMVALDRGGDPLYFVITETSLPELQYSMVNEVYNSVKQAVETYYQFNTHPGCMDPSSPNFSPPANVNDGSCRNFTSKLNFGGVYQTCSMSQNGNGDLCKKVTTQKNPLSGQLACPDGYKAVHLYTGNTSSSHTERKCKWIWPFTKCHNIYHKSIAHFDTYWCYDTGAASLDSGYLFGGLFTDTLDNPVTRAKTCPPTFFPLKVASEGKLSVCISDNAEFGEEYSVPFGGFISCQMGNPLAVSPVKGSLELKASGKLMTFFRDLQPDKGWPQECPQGYSRHLALLEQNCQINYCVGKGSLLGPILPPIKRPPFITVPSAPPPPPYNEVAFDPQTNTWMKDQAAEDNPGAASYASTFSSDDDLSASFLNPGVLTGIAVGAAALCIVLIILVCLAVKAKQICCRRKGVKADDRDKVTPKVVAVEEGGDNNALY